MSNAPLAERYQLLSRERTYYLERARDYATITLPSALPPQGHANGQRLAEPYQSFGAAATANLASKIAGTLLPSGHPSFTLRIPSEALIESQQMSEDKSVVQGLALSRSLAQREIERKMWRRTTTTAMIQLIITGNCLEYVAPDNSLRLYRLDQYVVVRDPSDTVIEIIMVDEFSKEKYADVIGNSAADDADLKLYTRIYLKDGIYHYAQEVDGKDVTPDKATWLPELLPYNALRWAQVPGESYGRGKVEEHIGDLRALEGLRKSLLDGAAMAGRHIFMVSPNAAAGNLRKRVASARNGDVISGMPDEVQMLQFQNIGGIQIVSQEYQSTMTALSQSFLMGPDRVRDAERVTAAEIRLLAEDLEGTLGGVFTMLSQEMQAPRIRVLLPQMQAQGKLPAWPEGSVEPEITTGLESLGQEQTLIKLQSAINLAAGLDPEREYTKTDMLLTKGYDALGFTDAVRTEAEAAKLREERAAMMAAQNAMPTLTQGQ